MAQIDFNDEKFASRSFKANGSKPKMTTDLMSKAMNLLQSKYMKLIIILLVIFLISGIVADFYVLVKYHFWPFPLIIIGAMSLYSFIAKKIKIKK